MGSGSNLRASDHELVAAMAAGDAEALRALNARYARMLASLAYRFLGDDSDAEEVAADVLWQAWREAALYDRAKGSVAAWLIMVARSRAIDRLRARQARRAPQRPEPLPPPAADPGADFDLAERAKMVKSAVSELEPRERELLELAYFSDLSHSEIAERSGIPLGTVKTRIRSAMVNLREALKRRQQA